MTGEIEIAMPTIHMNGTSPDELLEQFQRALDTLTAARRALLDAAPNARDYYVQSPGSAAWRQAYEEHEARVTALTGVLDQMEMLRDGVVKFQQERAARRERLQARRTS